MGLFGPEDFLHGKVVVGTFLVQDEMNEVEMK